MTAEFIFMLTRADRTVPDAMDRLAEVLACGLRHIGFKDLGLPLADLHRLAGAIRAGGGTLYLEVVSLDAAREAASARAAAELGVDFLLRRHPARPRAAHPPGQRHSLLSFRGPHCRQSGPAGGQPP
jgi:4-hydroxythreonine-4-phosphate dehydrogenase